MLFKMDKHVRSFIFLTNTSTFSCLNLIASVSLHPYLKHMKPTDQNITFDVLIEIPKGSRNKYEYDFALNKIRFDRTLFSSMMYPGDYGFIPETLALDKDPLDVLVLTTEPTFPMVVMEVKPIGVFHMTDEKGPDEKLICVPISDPIWSEKNDISDLNPHRLKEIEHFFQVYKDLEKKKVDVGGWGNREEAIEIYNNCVKRYDESEHKKKRTFII